MDHPHVRTYPRDVDDEEHDAQRHQHAVNHHDVGAQRAVLPDGDGAGLDGQEVQGLFGSEGMVDWSQ